MGALIILHGLFLLHCNERSMTVNKLPSQTCEILTTDVPSHNYKVGSSQTLYDLPPSKNMTVSLDQSSNRDPDSHGLDNRMMVLDSSIVSVKPDNAGMRIAVPMPDNLYGANVVRPFRDEVLNGTGDEALRSQPGGDNRMAVAETVILSYTNGRAFTLYDGMKPIAQSARIGNNNVLAIFAWPAAPGMDCKTVMNHALLNNLMSVKGQAPAFTVYGLSATWALDDQDVAGFKLPANLLRPPCVHDSVKSGQGYVRITTATQTGCGPFVDIEEQ